MFEKIRQAAWGALCVCLAAILCQACTGKAPEYPDLEGYWKQERIEDRQTGESRACDRLFWALQLGVGEVKDLGKGGSRVCLCRYEYNEGAATLRLYDFRIRGDQSERPGQEQLDVFGIPSEDTTFEVLLLDGDHMVLRSDKSVLHLRSF